MPHTQEKISRLKKLTALTGENEVNIDNVIDSFEVLRNENLNLPNSSTRSGKGTLLPREDIIKKSNVSSDELLHCSPQRIIGHQIALGGIMHGE